MMGREDLALETLNAAIRRAPTDGDLYAERAMLYSLLGWFPQARLDLKSAEARGAESLRLALVRATLARQEVDLGGARRILESALRQAPGDPELRRQLGAVAEAEGHFEEAARLLEPMAVSEADPALWVALARVLLADEALRSRNARAQARAAIRQALELRPGMPSALLLLGRSLRLSGELTEARAVLERLYQTQPQRPGVAFELAKVYRALGQAERARPLLAQHHRILQQREVMRRAALAVMTDPESATAHLEMGHRCREHGMIGRAILSLHRALALDPHLPAARAELARLRGMLASGHPPPSAEESEFVER
jgi:Flp pilus assembly protein TadD